MERMCEHSVVRGARAQTDRLAECGAVMAMREVMRAAMHVKLPVLALARAELRLGAQKSLYRVEGLSRCK
jgi:hypothetical protein